MAAPLRTDGMSPLPFLVFSAATTTHAHVHATAAAAAASSSSAASEISMIPDVVISPADIAAKAAGDRTAEQSRTLNAYTVAQVRYHYAHEDRDLPECQRCLDAWRASAIATDTAVRNAIKLAVDEAFVDTRNRFRCPEAQAAMIKKNIPPHRQITLINAFTEMYFQPDVQSAITNVFAAIKAYADENERKYDEDHPSAPASCQLL